MARLIVRRVRDLGQQAAAGQNEPFTPWRYHAVLPNSRFTMLQAEEHHPGHAQAEQVFADWTDGRPTIYLAEGWHSEHEWTNLFHTKLLVHPPSLPDQPERDHHPPGPQQPPASILGVISGQAEEGPAAGRPRPPPGARSDSWAPAGETIS